MKKEEIEKIKFMTVGKCYHCDGKGRFNDHAYEPCSFCGGTGTVPGGSYTLIEIKEMLQTLDSEQHTAGTSTNTLTAKNRGIAYEEARNLIHKFEAALDGTAISNPKNAIACAIQHIELLLPDILEFDYGLKSYYENTLIILNEIYDDAKNKKHHFKPI